MDTPIADFVERYKNRRMSRFHMPGHKGHVFFGWEPYDITEIKGADVLHMGDGIIRESEKNAGRLFGSGATHYSTEGSSHGIKVMLAVLRMESGQKSPFLLAARNIHRSMIDACALLDFDVEFIESRDVQSLCSVKITAEDVADALHSAKELPVAVYLTSPDYLGEISDISGISKVCEAFGIPLVVDNAHGAYLHFWEHSHPLDQGAAMCCDSAHKTLPVLTGGAYLHIHKKYVERFEPYVTPAMCLFGSTSPSYLVLQSLDLCNRYLSEGYKRKLVNCVQRLENTKKHMLKYGIPIRMSEPLKLVLQTAKCGYPGEEIAEELRGFGVECEYADREQVVFMITPENTEEDFKRLEAWAEKSVLVRERKEEIAGYFSGSFRAERVLRIREAVFAKSEVISVTEAAGRVCAAETVSCPPAVPVAVCGERITEEMIRVFLECGITKVSVVS